MNRLGLAFLAVGLLACSSTLDVGNDGRDGGPGDRDGEGPIDNNPPPDGGDPRGEKPHGTLGPPGAKRMFVTSAAYTGDFANEGTGSDPGADGADKLCGKAAVAANLGGIWKAWISSHPKGDAPTGASVHNAIDRINDVPGGWYNVDRTAWLFTNKANLAGVPNASEWQAIDKSSGGGGPYPMVSLVKDEMGRHLDGYVRVWTGTKTGGRLDVHSPSSANGAYACWGWSSSASNGGTSGAVSSDPTEWTATPPYSSCSDRAHLYCLEQ